MSASATRQPQRRWKMGPSSVYYTHPNLEFPPQPLGSHSDCGRWGRVVYTTHTPFSNVRPSHPAATAIVVDGAEWCILHTHTPFSKFRFSSPAATATVVDGAERWILHTPFSNVRLSHPAATAIVVDGAEKCILHTPHFRISASATQQLQRLW